ncbi:unnamed protein product [Rotaria magnacalcarata]|uniref:Uncharacterized protein n=1 Tax=Rotaria magnacalcarata TaxID=392030 RepID=A0A818YSU6_9BILA|nr:unnamed protein product [Rotaria magnacalcarata]CAF1270393.1 unnamed protein product [Rotaria magnacalcarata]CAF1949801.1 unnamed protein product [Rotaria magnacalcarata]CAF2076960.1 unnamed protein product [Rotaria magnacalcarata]CAF2140751.1 unnamed protein product [Rotaria magnacalcarata]
MHSNSLNRQQSGGTVLHSLHSQLSNAAIDYSPWMRQQRRPLKSATTTTTTATGLPPLHDERKCSARCRHLRKEPSPERLAPENPAKIQWLTVQLNMYRTRIQSFIQREHELKKENTKLRDTISNVEHSGHDTVAVNLRRFDQYKKTAALVQTKQNKEKEELLDNIDQKRQALANEVEMYENQVLTLENQIGDCQQFLKQLKTYKDSEYPEKEQALQKLNQEIDETKLFGSEEIDELNRILEKQQEQHLEALRQTAAQLKEQQATAAFSDMHMSYLFVALDNDRMREEIAIQEEKLRLLEIECKHIKRLNAKLKSEKTQAFDSRTLFPHVYRQDSMAICTPDMDVIIDFPERQSPLPI